MRFRDIPPIVPHSMYTVDTSLSYLDKFLDTIRDQPGGLDLEPDFQRGHVWSEAQQVAFVEFMLRGGFEISGNILLFNCIDFHSGCHEPTQLVDGLQRLTATLRFLNNEIAVFGAFRDEYEDATFLRQIRFSIRIADLPRREDVLRWYVDLNSGGTIHSQEEIQRIRTLIEAEEGMSVTPSP